MGGKVWRSSSRGAAVAELGEDMASTAGYRKRMRPRNTREVEGRARRRGGELR